MMKTNVEKELIDTMDLSKAYVFSVVREDFTQSAGTLRFLGWDDMLVDAKSM